MFGTGSENEEFYNDIEFAKSTISGFWSEKVYVVTEDYESRICFLCQKQAKRTGFCRIFLTAKNVLWL